MAAIQFGTMANRHVMLHFLRMAVIVLYFLILRVQRVNLLLTESMECISNFLLPIVQVA